MLWQNLKKPILGLAPMDGVTDAAFRFITKKYGSPDIVYTEFVSVESICRSGKTYLLKEFLYSELERPIIAQIYGKTPDYFYQVAVLLCYLGFDGIDINMGCPSKSVTHSGCGAALINNPELAVKIVAACKKAILDYQNNIKLNNLKNIKNNLKNYVLNVNKKNNIKIKNIPVSVKSRIGFDKIITQDWIKILLETKPAAIVLHGRTLKQGYSGQANWGEIKKAADLCKKNKIIILGNGDIKNYNQAIKYSQKYHTDGVLIGRAAFGNPFVFCKPPVGTGHCPVRGLDSNGEICRMAQIALEHAQYFEKIYSGQGNTLSIQKYSFLPMRKHLAWYIKSVPNAAQIRSELVLTNSAKEVEEVLKKYKLV